MKWREAEQLQSLLEQLVGWDSRTGTNGEKKFPYLLMELLQSLCYFEKNRRQLTLHNVGSQLHALTALYKYGKTKNTIILMSHFDTVHIDDYGELSTVALQPNNLIEQLRQNLSEYSEDVQKDIQSKEYLFGRGTMDMKIGLALHLHILEKAIVEKWPVNILLVTVPDEEVNSLGMRGVVPNLVDLGKQFSLQYELVINSEPTFAEAETDETYHIYTGSIGKMMPAALFFGKETHAGQPLSGLTSHIMAAHLTKAMEWNDTFVEKEAGEVTPYPICLQMNDLKTAYSVQTSHHSYALYNVFVFNRNAEQIMEKFKQVTIEAMNKCDKQYANSCQLQQIDRQTNPIQVLEFHELRAYVIEKHGSSKVGQIESKILQNNLTDEREKSIKLCDELMNYCPELAPATIIFFAPSYYPSVNTAHNTTNKKVVAYIGKIFKENFNMKPKHIHYFPGISDLSYISYDQHDEGWKSFKQNSPGWGDVYEIPFEDMKKLQIPLINLGPFGKDAHKETERLHKKSAFLRTPFVLEQIIRYFFK